MVKATEEQINRLVKMVESGELDAVTVRAILEKRLSIANGEVVNGRMVRSEESVYTITVDGSLSLDDLVKRGIYYHVDGDMTAENFPLPPGEGIVEAGLVLVRFRANLFTKDVLSLLDWRGLQPARIEHLLALGYQHPLVQCESRVVALGSVCKEDSEYPEFPLLSSANGARYAAVTHHRPWSWRDKFLALWK